MTLQEIKDSIKIHMSYTPGTRTKVANVSFYKDTEEPIEFPESIGKWEQVAEGRQEISPKLYLFYAEYKRLMTSSEYDEVIELVSFLTGTDDEIAPFLDPAYIDWEFPDEEEKESTSG